MADDAEDFFERQIRPLLAMHCVKCHGPDKQEGELRLDSRQQVLTGNDDHSALIDLKNVDDSRLLQVLLYSEDDIQMPPKEKLSDQQIAEVRHWIETGAAWPEDHDFGRAAAVRKDAVVITGRFSRSAIHRSRRPVRQTRIPSMLLSVIDSRIWA